MFNFGNVTDTQKALSEDKIVQYAHGHTGGRYKVKVLTILK